MLASAPTASSHHVCCWEQRIEIWWPAQGIDNFTTGATGPLTDYEADCTTDVANERFTSFYGAGLVDAFAAPFSIKVMDASLSPYAWSHRI